MIVVDAGVVVAALVDDAADGDLARARLSGERLAAPQLMDLEVTSVLRRALRLGRLSARRAESALHDLLDLPVVRAPHGPLLARCWSLRDNLTVYDASYVALAEALGVTLVTSDAAMVSAPGVRCAVELLGG